MVLSRRIKIQLIIFSVITMVAGAIMVFAYMQLPRVLFGVGYYTVRMELPQAGGLYHNGNVTYRGVDVGRVDRVQVTDTGVEAVLSLKSGVRIPADLDAQVHSQTPIGEQFVALLPRTGEARPLRGGDVIPRSRTSVPPDITELLDATNRGLQAIPHDGVRTVIDESYTAFGGLGPEIARIVRGSTKLATDARRNLDSLTALIDQSEPVMDTQTETSDAIRAWAAHLAAITGQLQTEDHAAAGILEKGGPAADEARELIDRLKPTLPIVLANLASVAPVAVAYHDGIEQLLVLLPQGTAIMQAISVPNRNVKGLTHGSGFLDFNLNFGLPPPCTTGYLPARQMRTANFEDYPDRPDGDMYCRIPQDSPWYVRGARNIPCATKPGKRAPTAAMCESDEEYVPLNEGFNWKGDPNATYTGQDIPQLRPGSTPVGEPPTAAAAPPPEPGPPIAATAYDPSTGTYVGPDGRVYTQSDLAQTTAQEPTWQTMMMPPTDN